jgi:hypothetical protein
MSIVTIQAAARRRRARPALGVIAAAAALSISAAATAAVNLQEMVGYWTGTGKIVLNNGNTENVKCVVTYKLAGTQLKQNLRCAGQGYSLNGTADLVVAPNGSVTGPPTRGSLSPSPDPISRPSWTRRCLPANNRSTSCRRASTSTGFPLVWANAEARSVENRTSHSVTVSGQI